MRPLYLLGILFTSSLCKLFSFPPPSRTSLITAWKFDAASIFWRVRSSSGYCLIRPFLASFINSFTFAFSASLSGILAFIFSPIIGKDLSIREVKLLDTSDCSHALLSPQPNACKIEVLIISALSSGTPIEENIPLIACMAASRIFSSFPISPNFFSSFFFSDSI